MFGTFFIVFVLKNEIFCKKDYKGHHYGITGANSNVIVLTVMSILLRPKLRSLALLASCPYKLKDYFSYEL